MNIRLCKLVEHQSQSISFVNLHPKATQRLACGLCYFESQDKQYYIKISEFPQRITKLLGTYTKYEETINISQPKLKKMVEQLDIYMQNLKSYSLNQQQTIRSEFNNTQQKLKYIAECQPHLLTEDDIQYYYQIQQDNSRLNIKMNQNLQNFDQLIQIFQNQIDIIDSIIQPMTSITEIETTLIQQFQVNDLISNQMKIQLQDIQQDSGEQMKTIKITQNQEYIGSSNNNQPDGFGSLFDSQTNIYYKGIWDKGLFKYGIKVDLQNQLLFKGNFTLSKLNKYEINGDGYFINQQGDNYEGHFENDVFSCQGTMIYANQASYKGQWYLGKYEGEGHYEDKNRIYEGEFSHGLFEGQGTLEDLQTKSVYKGRFNNDKYNGKGTLILKDPKVKQILQKYTRYKGMFQDNKLHGYAKEIIEINENKQQEEEGDEIDITKSLYKSLTKRSVIQNEPKKIKKITEGEYVNGLKNDIHNQYTVINKIKQKKILYVCLLIIEISFIVRVSKYVRRINEINQNYKQNNINFKIMKCSKLEHDSLPYQYLDVTNNSFIFKCQICYLLENEQQQQKLILITDKEKMKMQLQNIYKNKSVDQQQLHASIGVKSKEWRKILDYVDEQFQQYAEQQIQINQSSLQETIKIIEQSEGILKIIDIYKENEKKINQISFQIEKLMTQVQKGLAESLKHIFLEKQDFILKEAQLKYQIPEYLIKQFKNLDDCLVDLQFDHCYNYHIILTQKPDQIYIGGVNECDNRHGLGMQLNSSDKQLYNGLWIENHFYQGSILDLTKQELFQGTIKEIDSKYTICGEGFWTNANKETYKGEFLMNQFEGFGVKINKDNSKYEGNFRQGIFHGKGKLQFDAHTFFNGNFIDGHLNGKGEFTCPEYIYEGSYQNDQKHGIGTYLELKTKIKYQGEFFKNERHGEGILEIPNKYKYKGQFQAGQQSGEGEEEYFIEKSGEFDKEKGQTNSIFQQLVDQLTKIRVVQKGNYIKNNKHDIFLCKYFYGDKLIKEWQPFNLISYKQYDNGIELGEF